MVSINMNYGISSSSESEKPRRRDSNAGLNFFANPEFLCLLARWVSEYLGDPENIQMIRTVSR